MLLIYSIILLQLTPVLQQKITLLVEVDGGETFRTLSDFNFTSSDSCYTEGSTISDINLNSTSLQASTLVYYTNGKEVLKEG